VCAETGADALKLLQSGEFLGVVSDMRMPGGVDGAQVYAWISEHRPELVSRFVFTTGDIANDETAATLSGTGAPCLEKPFSIQQLISVVEKTMGKAASRLTGSQGDS
jgi:DNA-binding NtrC family response regulator